MFTTTIQVLVNHLNYGNHLAYDAVLNLLQETRLRWLKSTNQNPNEVNIEDNIGWIISEVHASYLSEGHYGDLLEINMRASNHTKTAFTLEYEIFNQTTNKKLCKATTNQVCFNYHQSKISRIPEILLKEIIQLQT